MNVDTLPKKYHLSTIAVLILVGASVAGVIVFTLAKSMIHNL